MYLINKILFNSKVLPSIAIRTRFMSGDKATKERTNFLVSLLLPGQILNKDGEVGTGSSFTGFNNNS